MHQPSIPNRHFTHHQFARLLISHLVGYEAFMLDVDGLSSSANNARQIRDALIAYPEPDRISSGLKSNYRKLGKIDSRNDSQVISYDQIIPASTIIAYANADHWAMAVPLGRSHKFISSTMINKNDFLREALFEALLRYVEEDLGKNSH